MNGNKKTSDSTRLIERVLGSRFPQVQAYQYNPWSIRVRVISPVFAGVSRPQREERLADLLQQLPEEIQQNISVLLLLSPEELSGSLMNLEFEHPSPSML